MYHYLKGIIVEKILEPAGSEKVILDVNGIGYEISTCLSSLNLIGKKGDTTTVYTTLIHKEDQMSLIGFPTLLERELFNLLFSVSGVGAKTALNLLNSLTATEVVGAILNENPTVLSKAQGIGGRTASRLILELQEKIKNWQYLPIVYLNKNKESGNGELSLNNQHSALNEARSVLQALGYTSQDINQAFNHAKEETDSQDPESLIHFSLKWLASVKKSI